MVGKCGSEMSSYIPAIVSLWLEYITYVPNSCLPISLDRLENEITRLTTFKALILVASSWLYTSSLPSSCQKLTDRPAPSGTSPWATCQGPGQGRVQEGGGRGHRDSPLQGWLVQQVSLLTLPTAGLFFSKYISPGWFTVKRPPTACSVSESPQLPPSGRPRGHPGRALQGL